jgi:hypothetical protein
VDGTTIEFWVAISGNVGAGGALALQYLAHKRTQRREDVSDEVAYLQRQINDLKRQNDVCESRCEELREHVLELMAQVTPKRKRQKVDRQT